MRSSILVLLLMGSLGTMAQYHTFLNLGIEDGLAQSQVNDMAQGPGGYLWVATASGLSRFDGTEVKNFYKSDGLVDNVVTSILVSDDGELFFGGVGGFTQLTNGEFFSYPFPRSFVDSRVQHMQLVNDSTLWIATNRNGYFSFSLNTRQFEAPILDHGTNIRWLDIPNGLIAGSRGLFSFTDRWPSRDDLNISDVHVSADRLWCSTLGDGLWTYTDKWNRVAPPQDMEVSYLRDILISSEGAFWGVGPDGAVTLDQGEWNRYTAKNGLAYDNLRAVKQDREGNIWLASNGQGIYRFTGDLFSTYATGNPLQSELMLSAVEYGDAMYLGMFDEGLQLIRSDGKVEDLESFIRTDVWSLLRDQTGRIWAGTSTGLYRSVDGKSFTRLYEDDLPSNRITSLFEDDFGNIHIGHREGATVVYGDDEFMHLIEETGFEGRRVRAIQQSIDGAMWLGAQNGLYRIDDEWVMRLDESSGLNDNTIYSIQDDPWGRLWVGAKNGLHILMSDSVIQVMLSGQVDANNINFLHCSKAGQLYVGTNQGLFSAQVLEDVAQMNFRQYGIQDGLPGLECNLNAIYQQGSGQVWFGTNKGVVRFDEEEFLEQAPLPEPVLHITGIRLYAEPFDISTRSSGMDHVHGLPIDLTFQPDENHITFDFKGVRLSDPGSITYEYRMDGLESQWTSAGNSTSITYSSLGFGKYCFMVRCVDEDGNEIGEMAQIDFRILPPIYLRWWALLIEAILISALVLSVIRWRREVRQRKQSLVELGYKNRMQSLEQQSLNSSMNRHFIFNALNAIQYYINREDKRSANRYLSSFAKLIRKNLDSTATTWVSLQDEIERLELYLHLESMRFNDRFSYHIHVDPSLDTASIRVPSMLLQPFVENSIWHGILPKPDAGRVDVDIQGIDDRMRIRIQDDGIGIDESQGQKNGHVPDHESKGMNITQHRLNLYSEMTGTSFEIIGPVQLEEEGMIKGTRIDILIPLREKEELSNVINA